MYCKCTNNKVSSIKYSDDKVHHFQQSSRDINVRPLKELALNHLAKLTCTIRRPLCVKPYTLLFPDDETDGQRAAYAGREGGHVSVFQDNFSTRWLPSVALTRLAAS